MRIGVNAGSLEREMARIRLSVPPAMVDSALRYLEIAESRLSRHHCVSQIERCHHRRGSVSLYAKQANYPTHIGITERARRVRGHQVGMRPGAHST